MVYPSSDCGTARARNPDACAKLASSRLCSLTVYDIMDVKHPVLVVRLHHIYFLS